MERKIIDCILFFNEKSARNLFMPLKIGTGQPFLSISGDDDLFWGEQIKIGQSNLFYGQK
jgi:hypothetical protein